jgi:imidazole glycerol-phosphate synthase subunit HisF
VANAIAIPLTVGGGIASIADIEMVLEAGASKISMNSAAVRNPELIRDAASRFGSQTVTVAIDARRNERLPSGFELVVSGGTEATGQDAVAWASRCAELGAGCLLPTSMDGDGTQAGYDLPFTRAIADAVELPVVASGGAGKLEDFYAAATEGHAAILLAASVFHFRKFSIREVKEYLSGRGLEIRLE